jgi:hypothetical protein
MKQLLEACGTVLGIEVTEVGPTYKLEKNGLVEFISNNVELPELRIRVQLFYRSVLEKSIKTDISKQLINILNL